MSMKPSAALRPKPGDLIVALAVLAAAGGLAASAWMGGGNGGLEAVISLNGQTEPPVVLSRLEEPLVRELTANGYHLRLRLTAQGAEMLAADCPGEDCVRTGAITRSGQSIVCLPGRFSVALTGGGPDGVDLVLG